MGPTDYVSSTPHLKDPVAEALYFLVTASVVLWSDFLTTDPEAKASIPGSTGCSEK
jgi:hypothetical protein